MCARRGDCSRFHNFIISSHFPSHLFIIIILPRPTISPTVSTTVTRNTPSPGPVHTVRAGYHVGHCRTHTHPWHTTMSAPAAQPAACLRDERVAQSPYRTSADPGAVYVHCKPMTVCWQTHRTHVGERDCVGGVLARPCSGADLRQSGIPRHKINRFPCCSTSTITTPMCLATVGHDACDLFCFVTCKTVCTWLGPALRGCTCGSRGFSWTGDGHNHRPLYRQGATFHKQKKRRAKLISFCVL